MADSPKSETAEENILQRFPVRKRRKSVVVGLKGQANNVSTIVTECQNDNPTEKTPSAAQEEPGKTNEHQSNTQDSGILEMAQPCSDVNIAHEEQPPVKKERPTLVDITKEDSAVPMVMSTSNDIDNAMVVDLAVEMVDALTEEHDKIRKGKQIVDVTLPARNTIVHPSPAQALSLMEPMTTANLWCDEVLPASTPTNLSRPHFPGYSSANQTSNTTSRPSTITTAPHHNVSSSNQVASECIPITHIRGNIGRLRVELMVLSRHGTYDLQNAEYRGNMSHVLKLECTDASGMHLISVWMFADIAETVGGLFFPGKWVSLENFEVQPANSKYHLGTWLSAIHVVRNTHVLEIPNKIVELNLAESGNLLFNAALTSAEHTYDTIQVAVVGISAKKPNHSDLIVVDDPDDPTEYMVEFYRDMEGKFNDIKGSFFAGQLPVKYFINIEGTKQNNTFKASPCTIIYDVPVADPKRQQLKALAQTYKHSFEGVIGSFKPTNIRDIGPMTLCSVCGASFNRRLSHNMIFCYRCKFERLCYQRLTIHGTLTTVTGEIKICMRDCFGDQVYGLRAGRLLELFDTNETVKALTILRNKHPYGKFVLDSDMSVGGFIKMQRPKGI